MTPVMFLTDKNKQHAIAYVVHWCYSS